MNLSELPDENDPAAVFRFAMTFDGYEHFGSFEAAADAARLGDRSSLDLLRNELFMSARASRHSDDDRYLHTYRAVLPWLRQHAR